MQKSIDDHIVFSQSSLPEFETSGLVRSHSTSLLFIALDCLYYNAGEKVNGELLLNLPSDFPEGSLRLCSKGFEQVKVLNKSLTHLSTIYNLETVVHSWKEKTCKN